MGFGNDVMRGSSRRKTQADEELLPFGRLWAELGHPRTGVFPFGKEDLPCTTLYE